MSDDDIAIFLRPPQQPRGLRRWNDEGRPGRALAGEILGYIPPTVSRTLLPLSAALACLALAGCSGSVTGTGTQTGSPSQTSGTTPNHAAPGTGTGTGHTLGAARPEHAIAVQAQAQSHQKTTVTCPPRIAVKAGLQFYCAAQAGGEVTPFLVTEQAGGKLAYKALSPLTTPSVDMPQVEIDIAQALAAKHETASSVLCPQEMPRQQGLAFVCAVTISAGKTTRRTSFVVSEVNSIGRVTFAAR